MAEFSRGDRPLIVVRLQWQHDGQVVQRTYGPWAVADDDSQMADITEFMTRWKARNGCDPDEATMETVIAPSADAD